MYNMQPTQTTMQRLPLRSAGGSIWYCNCSSASHGTCQSRSKLQTPMAQRRFGRNHSDYCTRLPSSSAGESIRSIILVNRLFRTTSKSDPWFLCVASRRMYDRGMRPLRGTPYDMACGYKRELCNLFTANFGPKQLRPLEMTRYCKTRKYFQLQMISITCTTARMRFVVSRKFRLRMNFASLI